MLIFYSGYDGAGLCYDIGDSVVLMWIHQRTSALRKDRGDVPSVLGAAVVSVSLRLRHESRQVCAHSRRKPQG